MEIINENVNENPNQDTNNPKQRHGCVSAWLILTIIINSMIAVIYLFASDFITKNLPGNVSSTMIILLGIASIGNVVFAVLLLKWKKIGFWGFIVTSTLALIINLSLGLGIRQSLFGLIGIAVLYGVLQIRKDDVKAWDNLE